MKNLLPHILTVILFVGIYSITEFVPNEDLYLGYGRGWNEVETNNKLPIQGLIFCFGLPTFLILMDYLLGLITQKGFLNRGLSAIVTLTSIFIVSGGIFRLWGSNEHWSMFSYPRGTPAIPWFFTALMVLVVGLTISNMTKNSKLRLLVDGFIAGRLTRKLRI